LSGGTRVVMAHMNGHPDKPFLLGALPDAHQPSPVNHDNETNLIMRHASGSALIFNDTESSQCINIHTECKEHTLQLRKDGDKESIYGQSMGSIDLKAHLKLSLNTGDDYAVQAHKIEMRSGGAYSLTANKKLMLNGYMIDTQAKGDWLCESLKHTTMLQVTDHLNIAGSEVKMKSNGFTLRSSTFDARAKKSFVLYAAEGVSFDVGPSSCQISSGVITFASPQIMFEAKAIINNQGTSAAVLNQ
jgi:hypothetical protein